MQDSGSVRDSAGRSPVEVELSGKRCLVTGGTGFIGGRLVERLVREHDARVRVLVRNLSRASRIGRFPVEMVQGDVADPAVVERAAEGCDVAFHCAYGATGDPELAHRITVGGTRNVLDAAARHGLSRVVNVSTLAVYGETGDGDLTESSPRQRTGDSYADTKLEAEELTLERARRGEAATVVQPTMVYGPFGPAWTVRILNDMKAGRVILVNGGDGLCNPVYVDDLVDGMLLSAVRDEAVGECFLLSGAEPVTWSEFYGRHERMLGIDGTLVMSAADAEADFARRFGKKDLPAELLSVWRGDSGLRRRLKSTPGVRQALAVGRAIVPFATRQVLKARLRGERTAPKPPGATETASPASNGSDAPRPILPMGPGAVRMHAAKTHVRIDKARRVLGYTPAFDFETGAGLTEEWARWAALL